MNSLRLEEALCPIFLVGPNYAILNQQFSEHCWLVFYLDDKTQQEAAAVIIRKVSFQSL